MKVSELKAILAQYPDDVDVTVEGECHELRDVVDLDGKLVRTVVEFHGSHCGAHLGYSHLTDAERLRQRDIIIDALAEMYRPVSGNYQAFTTVHGDMRLYSPMSRMNDTHYGTAYDPRVWKELEAEGLIEFHGKRWEGERCGLTDKGRELAKEMDRKRPKAPNVFNWPLSVAEPT